MSNPRSPERRRTSGSFMVLVTIFASLILLPLGICAFELERVQLVQKQLHVATDAAALAGGLAASELPYDTPAERLQLARDAALAIFKMNTAGPVNLSHAHVVDSLSGACPDAGDVQLYLELSEDKQELTATACCGYTPAFGAFLGLAQLPVLATSKTGIVSDKRDIVIVFDTSGSMDPVMTAAKQALVEFVTKLHNSGDVHFGFVTYNTEAGGHRYGTNERWIKLNRSSDNYLAVLDAIRGTIALGNTNTAAGLETGIDMITGSGRRPDADASVILVSDGVPNYFNRQSDEAAVPNDLLSQQLALAQADRARSVDIPLHSLGFFHQAAVQMMGPQFIQNLRSHAGGESEAYTATTIAEFKGRLHKLCAAGVALTN